MTARSANDADAAYRRLRSCGLNETGRHTSPRPHYDGTLLHLEAVEAGVPKVSADPYDVIIANEHDFVEHVLKAIEQLPTDYEDGVPSRWYDLGDGWLCIDRLARTAGGRPRWEGAIQRVFTRQLPSQSGPRGSKDIELEEDEGLGEHVAFLYDETDRLLWLQRDRRVCGKLMFFDYLTQMSGVSVGAAIRLRNDAIKRAKKLKVIRGIEFAFLEKPQPDRGPLGRMLDRFSRYGAARIEVRLKPSRGGTLENEARDLVTELANGIDEELIAHAEIKGRYEEDDDNDQIINLLRDRAYMATGVADHRRQDAQRLVEAVRSIWQTHRDSV